MSTAEGSHTVPLLIAGKEITTSTTFSVTSPSTSSTAWTSSSASVDDATRAVEAAHAAFPVWSRTSPSERRDIFLKTADLLEQRSDELAGYMKTETGADDAWAGFNVSTTVEGLRDVAGRIAGAVEGVLPTCADKDKMALVLKEPYGVVLAIAPW